MADKIKFEDVFINSYDLGDWWDDKQDFVIRKIKKKNEKPKKKD